MLTEGSRFIARVPTVTRPLRGLAGLNGIGEPLWLRPGLFNVRADACYRLTHRVVDRGVCHHEGLLLNPDRRELRVRLRRPLEPRLGDHTLVVLNTRGELHPLPVEASEPVPGESATRDWISALPDSAGEPWAAAVAYAGRRLGAAWYSDWPLRVDDLRHALPSDRLAEILRWFHLPVLEEQARAIVQSLGRAYPAEYLCAWTRPGYLQAADGTPLEHGTAGPWQDALAGVWQDWRPAPEAAHALCPLEQSPIDALQALAIIDPILCRNVARAWLDGQPQRSRADSDRQILFMLTQVDSPARINDGEDSLGQRCLRGFNRLGTAEAFLQGVVETARTLAQGRKPKDEERLNLAAALGFSAEMGKLVLCGLWFDGPLF